ncbi:MAG: hypothetical protein M8860_00370 [marine benthic group bacterium]|nr:hypothetical protein [Gemmatimonadota bacterium]MCL7961285.1 hypothetical protein [Candidatus Carthagonibacter metallireducens]MCL7956436.1 hypothetical protein [Gemmatimonadota bacterium]MCL7967423.1 hypothetical protein [Gemmatimonadota bacterium]MCL7969549.1 hypothetical protein [Gemmatimonadota bacterium]
MKLPADSLRRENPVGVAGGTLKTDLPEDSTVVEITKERVSGMAPCR